MYNQWLIKLRSFFDVTPKNTRWVRHQLMATGFTNLLVGINIKSQDIILWGRYVSHFRLFSYLHMSRAYSSRPDHVQRELQLKMNFIFSRQFTFNCNSTVHDLAHLNQSKSSNHWLLMCADYWKSN